MYLLLDSSLYITCQAKTNLSEHCLGRNTGRFTKNLTVFGMVARLLINLRDVKRLSGDQVENTEQWIGHVR